MKFATATLLALANGIVAMPWSGKTVRANDEITIHVKVDGHSHKTPMTHQSPLTDKYDICWLLCASDEIQCPKGWVKRSCTATILGKLSELGYLYEDKDQLFDMRANTQCDKLQLNEQGQIAWVVVKYLPKDAEFCIRAKKYVICTGAVLTPGILFKSGFSDRLPALGHYMNEHRMAFCQVVLNKSLVDSLENDPR
ncbi:hypothetical protein FDECE_5475 [Fusarium decemcellulare]|nr:hypothetical protein FDECE_5475 [Fusarium decemcellulare]